MYYDRVARSALVYFVIGPYYGESCEIAEQFVKSSLLGLQQFQLQHRICVETPSLFDTVFDLLLDTIFTHYSNSAQGGDALHTGGVTITTQDMFAVVERCLQYSSVPPPS
uniref:Uncharacterized protein n=1 Tax=Lygus hesperus TaxID=30085 RepID=A0A0A9XFH2_LYGHE